MLEMERIKKVVADNYGTGEGYYYYTPSKLWSFLESYASSGSNSEDFDTDDLCKWLLDPNGQKTLASITQDKYSASKINFCHQINSDYNQLKFTSEGIIFAMAWLYATTSSFMVSEAVEYFTRCKVCPYSYDIITAYMDGRRAEAGYGADPHCNWQDVILFDLVDKWADSLPYTASFSII